jgi:hypothetical protein
VEQPKVNRRPRRRVDEMLLLLVADIDFPVVPQSLPSGLRNKSAGVGEGRDRGLSNSWISRGRDEVPRSDILETVRTARGLTDGAKTFRTESGTDARWRGQWPRRSQVVLGEHARR